MCAFNVLIHKYELLRFYFYFIVSTTSQVDLLYLLTIYFIVETAVQFVTIRFCTRYTQGTSKIWWLENSSHNPTQREVNWSLIDITLWTAILMIMTPQATEKNWLPNSALTGHDLIVRCQSSAPAQFNPLICNKIPWLLPSIICVPFLNKPSDMLTDNAMKTY